MTKYDVTFTKNTRYNGVRYTAGESAEVDESGLEELQRHSAVEHITEKKAKASPKKAPAKAPTSESGE